MHTEQTLFDAIFAEDEPGPTIDRLAIDVSDAAKMDLYNQEELDDWPVGPEEDYMAELLAIDTSTAERREANEIVELFLTHGVALPIARAKVAELYSPPRVTTQLARLPQLHLSPGQTFDLRQDRAGRSWNFLLEADRVEAKRLIQEERPYIVIGSPPCTSFCSFNRRFNYRRMDHEKVRKALHDGNVLLAFALEIYELQLSEGRHFLHEHPASAASWQVPRMVALRRRHNVGEVTAHLCQYGLTTPGPNGRPMPALKPTCFLSSAPELLKLLGQQCTRDHEHQPLVEGRAAAAAIYPPALCRAMLRGIAAQHRREGEPLCLSVLHEMDAPGTLPHWDTEYPDWPLPGTAPQQHTPKRVRWADETPLDTVAAERVANTLATNCTKLQASITALQAQALLASIAQQATQQRVAEGSVPPEDEQPRVLDETQCLEQYAAQYWDAITSEPLPPHLTAAARQEELGFMNSWKVWDVVPVSQCLQRTGKAPLKGKWVDLNKGDQARPVIRCRWCAKEFNTYKTAEFFAATPPLEALRLMASHCASGRPQSRHRGRGGRKMLVIDARKAHLHAMADRLVYVDLPPEQQVPGMCARLNRCLYGTRDAPARWEAHLATQLIAMGFTRGLASPCCFKHSKRDLRCVVHGDDFVFVGPEHELRWVQQRIESAFLVKVIGQLGGDKGDLSELRVLNRVLRWTDDGILMEADPRHQEILTHSEHGKEVLTPGVKEQPTGAIAESPLSATQTTAFRSEAARCNYLGLDRPDIAFAAKELCRRMSLPDRAGQLALQRFTRYLKGSPRLVYNFPWQDASCLDVFVDTDFAGCLATRRSTSGGIALHGTHLIKHWSCTQKAVTLSSAEAELYGLVKGTTEALGIQSWGHDLGIALPVRMHADSAAAIGICRRSGIGRVRHLAVGQLWVQEGLRRGDFTLYKVRGDQNPADILTKAVPREVLDRHLTTLGLHRAAGRAASAPHAQLYELTASLGRGGGGGGAPCDPPIAQGGVPCHACPPTTLCPGAVFARPGTSHACPPTTLCPGAVFARPGTSSAVQSTTTTTQPHSYYNGNNSHCNSHCKANSHCNSHCKAKQSKLSQPAAKPAHAKLPEQLSSPAASADGSRQAGHSFTCTAPLMRHVTAPRHEHASSKDTVSEEECRAVAYTVCSCVRVRTCPCA